MSFQQNRPPSTPGLGDARLPGLINDLAHRLGQTQADLTHDTLHLPDRERLALATALVEFGEDLHHDLGLWSSLEQYNRDLFGTPLPLTLPPAAVTSSAPSLEDRVCHLLWNLYLEIYPEFILSPSHQDLRHLAAVTADFLAKQFARRHSQSGIKSFLAGPNKYGWQVKRKLIWLGRHSYLFRYHFLNYVEEQGRPADIGTIDDFICQATTTWSGLGVIDILAGLLPLEANQRQTLRQWYERHLAYYLILESGRVGLTLKNLVTAELYQVRMDGNAGEFSVGQTVFGSLLPWNGAWYWSGGQRLLGEITEAEQQDLVGELRRQAAALIYRYDKPALAKVRTTIERLEQTFLHYHGDDLVIYPDGLTMAGDQQRMYRLHNESLPETELDRIKETFDLATAQPAMPYPAEIIDNENGVGLFFNPGEGTEMMVHFNDVLSGFQKHGRDLSQDESDAIEAFIKSKAISPHFVRRVIRDYGSAAIAATFLIHDPTPDHYLDYLLRRYKGDFYRLRYPQVTLV